ncbi:MAG TPA: SUMF1/EgtB/PvdO family nonheme iron enzyme [Micropepsaceae bacterium]|nr:SUMF1/EgtB/PvdO family nonheme iron enzyme [Micropepsaceae bacterium]
MGAYALLVGISQFTDPRLAKLNAPRGDVEALAQVLQDPQRGGFNNVATCIDQDLQTIRDQLAALLDDRNPDDMVLLYYSGHGIMTKGQRLFLATGQTLFDRPQARSLSALEMRDMLEQSRAGKQVVILDCCHSGAFVDGAKGVAQTITDNTFGTDDVEGQYVLTATDALQFAYDAGGTLRESSAPAALSRFTGWLVDAIGKGDAAPDKDRITLDAVFDYLSRRARVEAAGMTPKRFVKRNSGEMVIARNPAAQAPKLPDEIIAQLDSKDWQARRDAVVQLGKLADRAALQDLVESAVTDRLSGERDVDVRAAMLSLLRRLGSAPVQPAPEPVSTPPVTPMRPPAPVQPQADETSFSLPTLLKQIFGQAKERTWRTLRNAMALAAVLMVVTVGMMVYRLLVTEPRLAAQRQAAEQAQLAEAAKQQEANAAKQKEEEAAKAKEAAANVAAPKQDLDPLAGALSKSSAIDQVFGGGQTNAPDSAPKTTVSKDRDAEFKRLTEEMRRQQAQAARANQQIASMEEKAKETIRQIAGSEFKDCAECPAMITLPTGSFTMGSSSSESGHSSDEVPQHRVTISQPFAVGKYEVTFAEWDACVADGGCNGYKPDDAGWGRGTHPVIFVSWNDAQSYIAWLRRKTGKPYRLLSEAEWEYAGRAATVSAFYWGARANTASAKYDSSNGTAPVGSYAPNSFGLHDMSGNVSEWAMDCLNKSYEGAPTDGSAWMTGDCDLHALRGGAWNSGGANLRSANRDWDASGFRVNRNGFRVARGL